MAESAFEGPRDSSISARQKQATMQNLPENFELQRKYHFPCVLAQKNLAPLGRYNVIIFFWFWKNTSDALCEKLRSEYLNWSNISNKSRVFLCVRSLH